MITGTLSTVRREITRLVLVSLAPVAIVLAGLPASGIAQEAGAHAAGPVLVIHGGAGTILEENMTAETEREIREAMTAALDAGWDVLEGGGSSLDAVEATIRVMEDSPLFNAGKGAVFTHEGANELDASIMDGRAADAGAVAGVRHVRNPISLARRVMEASPHVMLAREGAEEFALEQGVELVPTSYFFTERRWRSLQRAIERERETAAEETGSEAGGSDGRRSEAADDARFGTVGALALDRAGDLAAGTSTGGMTAKRWGRIGDSPVIAAGTWADEKCAVSSTGHGEFFIRHAVAHDICARVRYLEIPIADAAGTVVKEKLAAIDASGGVIALDAHGNVAMPFNTPGMYRGYRKGDETHIAFYGEER